ncbi:MAG: hypothetical protein KAR44_08270 [Candidatus Aegiribacteria sp.]|nr:hypothetical protein [Candidatus Aegiribacteria sp.]
MADINAMGELRNYPEYLDYIDRLKNLLEMKEQSERSMNLEKLREENEFWFADLVEGRYENSPLNPSFAAVSFGIDAGRFLSSFASQVQSSMQSAVLGNWNAVERLEKTWESLSKVRIDDAADILRDFWREPDRTSLEHFLRLTSDPSMTTVRDIALTARIDDPSCLYRYGLKVDRVHIDVFNFVYSLSVKELKDISDTFAVAYQEGLEEDNKLEYDRRTVSISLPMGYERLVPFMEESYTERGLNPHFAKMGPHFAIGDTCYSHQEDVDHFDKLTGKKLIAVQNDKSALRHTVPEEAYTNTHTDVTLPYTSLDSVTAVYSDGRKIDILRSGRFVLPVTEILNMPLEDIL